MSYPGSDEVRVVHRADPLAPRRSGQALPRSDQTLEAALATMRDLARCLVGDRGKTEWALVDVHDVEAFLARLPKARKRRLIVLRQFFRFARAKRIVLVDPTRDLTAKDSSNFRGATLTLDQQRRLFRRWSSDNGAHPHEALLSMLALLHGASSSEARMLRGDDVDHGSHSVRLGKRPHPVPLDPATWSVLQRCLAHRDTLRTDNPMCWSPAGRRRDAIRRRRPTYPIFLTTAATHPA